MMFAQYDNTGFIHAVTSHPGDTQSLKARGLSEMEVPDEVNGKHVNGAYFKVANGILVDLPPRVRTRRELQSAINRLQAEMDKLPPDPPLPGLPPEPEPK